MWESQIIHRKFNEYKVKIDEKETDKRINEIAKNQPNFKESPQDSKAKEGDLVIFDYKATVDDKPFKGDEGKNTQLTLGKDLFLKGFDKQLIGVKKGDEKLVEAIQYYKKAIQQDQRLLNRMSWFKRFIKNIHFKPSTIQERLSYLENQIGLKSNERILKNIEIDKLQPDYQM